MTREEWRELQGEDCHDVPFVPWEDRFTTGIQPYKSVSEGTLRMPESVAPAPRPEKSPGIATSWKKSGLQPKTYNPHYSRNKRAPKECMPGREHAFYSYGKDKNGERRVRCKHCGRTALAAKTATAS